MARTSIFEVRMRTGEGSESLGFFTDDFLATQAVNHLYERLRQAVLKDDPSVSIITSQVNAAGWDMWSGANKNSDAAVFWYQEASLYNAIPENITNFTLVKEA